MSDTAGDAGAPTAREFNSTAAAVDGAEAAMFARRAAAARQTIVLRRLSSVRAEAAKGGNGDVRLLAASVVALVDLLGELLSDPLGR